MIINAGMQGCPCLNTTSTLASTPDRQCQLSTGETGVHLTLGGSCVPFTYGSSTCLQHDRLYDPTCHEDQEHLGESIIPAYCFRPWCYVDVSACMKESEEQVYRSGYFSHESEVDLFYSYSTCNSTADDWFAVEEDIVGGSPAMGGVSIVANVPTFVLPMMYKRDGSGQIVTTTGSEYYDNSIPWEGVYLKYVNSVMEISNGDIRNITVTHRSKSSSLVHPGSSFTAAIQDLEDGLVDMAIGPFWITGQRLKMTSFTLPIVYDKTYLVVRRPGTNNSLNDQFRKVLAPFSYELWGLVLGIIFVAALLSVWYSDRSEPAMAQTERRLGLQRGTSRPRRRKIAYARLALDSLLEKGLFFCSAGVEQDSSASLPHKLLLFGFGFFILITVSAYVANLAAFLTLKSTDDVKTMDGAVAKGYTICAHPAVEAELRVAWPDAKFYFHKGGNEFPGVLDDYDANKCSAMAVGYEDTSMDEVYLTKLCERNLVYTGSIIIEMPIAFPIRPKLASGFSYWMWEGERRHDVSLQIAKDVFRPDIDCSVHFNPEDTEGSEYDEISVNNMFFPIMFFVAFAVLSVLLQIFHLRNVKQGKRSLVGRRSTLNLVADTGPRRQIKRKSKEDIYSTEDEDIILSMPRSIMKGDLPLDTNDSVRFSFNDEA